jgi:RimJ/RimL family protein N-acetyltransferase
VEVRAPDELTLVTAPALGRAVARVLRERPGVVWLNLEPAKTLDPAGLAVVADAVDRARAAGVACVVFPSAVVYRGLFQVGLIDALPLDKRRAWERGDADTVVEVEGSRPDDGGLSGSGLRLVRPTPDDLPLLGSWARDDQLTRMVGSQLLHLARHFGPHDPDFVTGCLGSATSLMLLIHPAAPAAPAVGFVRLYNVDLAQRFAFLETVIAPAPRRRTAWGIEASRLVVRYAVAALGLHRIEAKVYADNAPCINALRRHGFTLEGRLREAHGRDGRRSDILIFGILEREIRAGLPGGAPDLSPWRDEPA